MSPRRPYKVARPGVVVNWRPSVWECPDAAACSDFGGKRRLGLDLRESKGPVEVLAIDGAEKPAAN